MTSSPGPRAPALLLAALAFAGGIATAALIGGRPSAAPDGSDPSTGSAPAAERRADKLSADADALRREIADLRAENERLRKAAAQAQAASPAPPSPEKADAVPAAAAAEPTAPPEPPLDLLARMIAAGDDKEAKKASKAVTAALRDGSLSYEEIRRRALAASDPRLAVALLQALGEAVGKSGDPAAMQAVAALVVDVVASHPDAAVRASLLEELAKAKPFLGPREQEVILGLADRDPSADVQRNAIRVLGRHAEDAALASRLLDRARSESDPERRTWWTESLRPARSDAVTAYFLDVLRTESRPETVKAVFDQGALLIRANATNASDFTAAVSGALSRFPPPDVRRSAIFHLAVFGGLIGTPGGSDAIRDHIARETDPILRQFATDVLTAVEGGNADIASLLKMAREAENQMK